MSKSAVDTMTKGDTSVVSGKKKKKIVSLDAKKARMGWIFVLPFVIGFIAIYVPIIWDSIQYSFSNIVYGKNIETYQLEFVGLKNYSNAIFGKSGAAYLTALGEGLLKLLMDIPTIIVFSLFVAVLLNQKIIGRAAFRAIFFMPVILSTGLIASIDAANTMDEFASSGIDTGEESNKATEIVSSMDIERLFSNMVVGSELASTVAAAVNSIYDIVNRSGVQMLIFLAGLQSISPAIYESCDVEGATAWETFWKITFPMISPMILVNLVYTIIDSFTDTTNPVMGIIDQVATEGGDGRVVSSAMAWIYFLVVMLIIAACAGIASAFTFYQRRDK